MSRSAILEQLRELKLVGMLSAYKEIMGRTGPITVDQTLLELLQAEVAQRQLRAIRYQLGQARFPVSKDLDTFDFATSPVDEAHIRSLYEGSGRRGKFPSPAPHRSGRAPLRHPAPLFMVLLCDGRSSALLLQRGTDRSFSRG